MTEKHRSHMLRELRSLSEVLDRRILELQHGRADGSDLMTHLQKLRDQILGLVHEIDPEAQA